MTATLSDFDERLLDLVADGRTHEEVGQALGMSKRMAKYHTDKLCRLVGVGRKRDLIRWARAREAA